MAEVLTALFGGIASIIGVAAQARAASQPKTSDTSQLQALIAAQEEAINKLKAENEELKKRNTITLFAVLGIVAVIVIILVLRR